MRKVVVPVALLAGLLAVVFLVMPGIGAADPDLNDVPVHQHWLVQGTGASMVYLARVGPDFCDNDKLQSAFNQFHNNLHVSAGWGPAAPGLHDGDGVGIAPGPC